MATVLSVPEASTAASRWAIASKVFGRGPNRQARLLAERRGHPLGELGVGVDARAHGRPADRQLAERLGAAGPAV